MSINSHGPLNNSHAKANENSTKNQPDVVTQELRKGFEWSAGHAKLVVGSIIVVGVGLGILSLVQYMQKKNEMSLLSELYKIEKPLNEKKSKFDQALADSSKPQNKTDKTNAKNEDKNSASLNLATGDIEKDYGAELKAMESFIQKNASSKPAQIAALRVSEVYLKYQQPEKALQVLNQVAAKGSGLTTGLVLMQKMNALMDLKKCDDVMGVAAAITKEKDLDFMHGDAEIKKALCLEEKDPAQAQSIYEKLSKDTKAGETAKLAEKYLRSLKYKGI